MSKFSQLLKMINYLEGKQEPTTRKEIAEYLGVSERMIRKYLDDIKESECYNITSIPGAKGGIILNPKEQKIQKGIELTKEEKIYIKSMISLNIFEIEREYIRLSETGIITKSVEKVLENQIEIIESIDKKIKL